MIIISSCGTNQELRQLQTDAKKLGQIQAGINLPPYPAECRVDEPHAAIKVGDSKVSIIDRERRATDRANAKKNRCGPVFYDNVVQQFGTHRSSQ